MSEADEQRTVVQYCDLRHIPIFHIPNEGARKPSTASNLKSQGLQPGVPDLCIPVAKGDYHSLYIEMKAPGGKPTKKQVEWIWRLRDEGMCAWICEGSGNAIALIDMYMGL